MHRDLNYDEAVRMSWGLAQENGHVMMVQNTAREGYEEISSCIMQDYKGDEAIGARGASDQEGAMASVAYGARIMKELGLVPADVTVAMVGTVQEEDCDGLCRQYDEALQTRANPHNIFRSLPSAPPALPRLLLPVQGKEAVPPPPSWPVWAYRLSIAPDGPGQTKQKPTPHP